MIAINGKFLAQSVTGVQRVAREMTMALDSLLQNDWERELDVVLFCPINAPELLPLQKIRQVRVGRLRGSLWEQCELPFFVRRSRLISFGATAPLLHRDTVVTMHDAGVFAYPGNYTPGFSFYYRSQMRFWARRAKKILTVSEFAKREIVRTLGADPNNIAVIYNGADHVGRQKADLNILARFNLVRDRFIVAIGSDSPNKNFPLVARALSLLDNTELKLVIVGPKNLRVFPDAAKIGGDGIVRVGYVSDRELAALYDGALCLAFPSFYEGFGLPPVEAMSRGCPVVVSETSSLPEVCGAAALYCDPRDPQSLASAIRRLATDGDLRNRMRVKGRAHAKEYRWEKSGRKLVETLLQLERDGPPCAPKLSPTQVTPKSEHA